MVLRAVCLRVRSCQLDPRQDFTYYDLMCSYMHISRENKGRLTAALAALKVLAYAAAALMVLTPQKIKTNLGTGAIAIVLLT